MEDAPEPFFADRWDKLLLKEIFLELGHRPLSERQPQFFGAAGNHAKSGTDMLGFESPDSAVGVGWALKMSEPCPVESLDPKTAGLVPDSQVFGDSQSAFALSGQVNGAVTVIESDGESAVGQLLSKELKLCSFETPKTQQGRWTSSSRRDSRRFWKTMLYLLSINIKLAHCAV